MILIQIEMIYIYYLLGFAFGEDFLFGGVFGATEYKNNNKP
jgi:hypothetical protein